MQNSTNYKNHIDTLKFFNATLKSSRLVIQRVTFKNLSLQFFKNF